MQGARGWPAAVTRVTLAAFPTKRSRMLLSHPSQAPDETLVAELRDYPEWHRGRRRYAIWMAPVHCPALLAYLCELQARLGDLLHATERQAHLTLFVCGFEQPQARADDDFTAAQLRRQIDALARLRSPAGTLELGAPDSFASAAFVPVIDRHGLLQRWRAALAQGGREVRQAAYVPHITLGLYKRRIGAGELRQRLAELPAAPHSQLQIDELHFATYASDALFGRLDTQRRIPLG